VRRRLDQALNLLTGGARDVDERQRTLRATIEWSYELLSEEEKNLFARLAVFRGGCRLETAEVVCGAESELGSDVLDGLSSLVEKSLLRQRDDADGEPRFWTLETIREYALERLTKLSDEDAVRHQHANYFCELACGIAPALKTRDQLSGMQQLSRDHDNLRAALEWLIVRDASTAVGLAAALAGYWRRRGLLAEGREWLDRALSVADGCSQTTAALIGAGELALAQTDYAAAEGVLRKAIAAAEAEGDMPSLALGLLNLGWALSAHEETSEAESCGKRSVSVFRQLGDAWGTAHAVLLLEALAYYRGNFEEARRLSEQNLAYAREAGDPEVEAEGLATAATIARYMGEYARALDLGERALSLARTLENPYAISNALRFLAPSARLSGDPTKAEAYAREALALGTEIGEQLVVATAKFHLALADQGHAARAETLLLEALEQCVEMGDKSGVAACFARLGVLAAGRRKKERAVRLFGAADHLREEVNSPAPPSDRAELEPVINALRRELGETRASEVWAEGSAMTYENATHYALVSRH
jgi:tetratricopeptide (TPR) repeat protein